MSLQSQTRRDRQRLKDLNRHASLKRLIAILALLGFSFLFILFSNSSYMEALRVRAMDTLHPAIEVVQYPFEVVKIWWQDKEQYFSLRKKNKQLLEENDALKKLKTEIVSLRTENQLLKKSLHVPVETTQNFVTARIIARPNHMRGASFLLSAGSQDGIQEGDPIVNKDGVVGRVTWTSDKTSRIIGITDRTFRLPVKKMSTDEHFIFSGDGAKSLYLLHTEDDAVLEEGDPLVTSGRDGVFPPGIYVGKARLTKNNEFEIDTPASLKKVEYVRVLLSAPKRR